MGISSAFRRSLQRAVVFPALIASVHLANDLTAGSGSEVNWRGEAKSFKHHVSFRTDEGKVVVYYLPDDNDPGFGESVVYVFKMFLNEHGRVFDDEACGDFVLTLRSLANRVRTMTPDRSVTEESFALSIGLSKEEYNTLVRRAKAFWSMSLYNRVAKILPNTDDLSMLSHALGVGEKYKDSLNESVVGYAQEDPEEPAYKVRMLTNDDLIKVRKNVVRRYIEFGLNFQEGVPVDGKCFEAWIRIHRVVERKQSSEFSSSEAYDQTVRQYNATMSSYMDEELTARNITGAEKDKFLKKMADIYNSYTQKYESAIRPSP